MTFFEPTTMIKNRKENYRNNQLTAGPVLHFPQEAVAAITLVLLQFALVTVGSSVVAADGMVVVPTKLRARRTCIVGEVGGLTTFHGDQVEHLSGGRMIGKVGGHI